VGQRQVAPRRNGRHQPRDDILRVILVTDQMQHGNQHAGHRTG
jgi:hypothetical protein